MYIGDNRKYPVPHPSVCQRVGVPKTWLENILYLAWKLRSWKCCKATFYAHSFELLWVEKSKFLFYSSLPLCNKFCMHFFGRKIRCYETRQIIIQILRNKTSKRVSWFVQLSSSRLWQIKQAAIAFFLLSDSLPSCQSISQKWGLLD